VASCKLRRSAQPHCPSGTKLYRGLEDVQAGDVQLSLRAGHGFSDHALLAGAQRHAPDSRIPFHNGLEPERKGVMNAAHGPVGGGRGGLKEQERCRCKKDSESLHPAWIAFAVAWRQSIAKEASQMSGPLLSLWGIPRWRHVYRGASAFLPPTALIPSTYPFDDKKDCNTSFCLRSN
jgi:hypothetical protein